MPLVTILAKPLWYPSGDEARNTTEQWVTTSIGQKLTLLIPRILNVMDAAEGRDPLEPEHVWVNFGPLHPQSLNTSSLQIVINPGTGGHCPTSDKGRKRTAEIRDSIQSGLAIHLDAHNRRPSYDLEVIPASMSGHSVHPTEGIIASW